MWKIIHRIGTHTHSPKAQSTVTPTAGKTAAQLLPNMGRGELGESWGERENTVYNNLFKPYQKHSS